jgi:hypothetical protein
LISADVLIAAVYRAQADALVIEAQAKRRLADEYDAAQARGEVATRLDNPQGWPEQDGAPFGKGYKGTGWDRQR